MTTTTTMALLIRRFCGGGHVCAGSTRALQLQDRASQAVAIPPRAFGRSTSVCANGGGGGGGGGDNDDDGDDVTLEELIRAARLARIDVNVCSDASGAESASTRASSGSTSREMKLLEQVRASLTSFSRVRNVDVGDAEPLYNMADFLRQYRQREKIDDVGADRAEDIHEDELPAGPIDNDEVLALSSSSVLDGQYLVPKSGSSSR